MKIVSNYDISYDYLLGGAKLEESKNDNVGNLKGNPIGNLMGEFENKYKNEKYIFSDQHGTYVTEKGEKYFPSYQFESDRLIEIIEKLGGDDELKSELKNEIFSMLMELKLSKSRIIDLMRQFNVAFEDLNEIYRLKLKKPFPYV